MAKKEDIYSYLKEIEAKAKLDIKNNYIGYENYEVKTVKHFDKDVEFGRKSEKFDLTIVELQNPDNPEEIRVLYYLDGEERSFIDIIKEYETDEPIREVIEESKENKEKPENEKNEELEMQDLEELELEKDKEEDKKEDTKNDLKGKKPTHVLQTIDVNSTYIDNWTTVSRGFDLPPEVKQIAIASPIQKDDHIISSTMTMYMLDARGNIIENVHGKTIRDYFEIDDATGHNPMYDDNTKYELDGYAEKNKGQTMGRFKSKENPDLYLSIEQKEIGAYHEVYAGGRTLDGNDPVEIQLETRNEEIQTSLEMQEEFGITYKGEYEKEDKDKEADLAEKDDCKPEKISLENADGDKSTVALRCKHIPGTDMTWEELSEKTGEGIEKLQERFGRELRNGKEPEVILEDIEYDYEMTGHTMEHKHN